MAANPTFAATPKTWAAAFANADGTTTKDVVVAGANGSRVHMLGAATDESANRDIKLYVTATM